MPAKQISHAVIGGGTIWTDSIRSTRRRAIAAWVALSDDQKKFTWRWWKKAGYRTAPVIIREVRPNAR